MADDRTGALRRGRPLEFVLCLSVVMVVALVGAACTGSEEGQQETTDEGQDTEVQPSGEPAPSGDPPETPRDVTVDGALVSFGRVEGADSYALLDGSNRLTVSSDACDEDRCEAALQVPAGVPQVRVVAVRGGIESDPSDPVDLPAAGVSDFEPPPAVYVVRFVDDPDDLTDDEVAETSPIEVLREEFDTEEEAHAYVEEIRDEAGVLSAAVDEPGQLHQRTVGASDTAADDWYLDRLAIDDFAAAADGSGIVIAMLDTGVDASHPALEGRVLDGTTTSEPGTPGTAYPRDHGTAVAGLLVGDGTGSAPGAQVLPVDIFGQRDGFTTGDLVWGIVWAVDNGADLINISAAVACGDGGDQCGLELAGIDDAVGYAERNGVLVVTSAGNDGPGRQCDTPSNAASWPANLPLAVTVGGTGPDGTRWECSPEGGHVDVLAPAVDLNVLRSTGEGGPSRSVGAGTSFAAPLVTGIAARLKGMDPELSPTLLRMALANQSDAEGSIDVRAILQLILVLGDIDTPQIPDDRAAEIEVRSFTLVREGFPELRGEFETFDPEVTYHGYVSVREDGTIDGFGRTGPSFHGPHDSTWSCGTHTRGHYRTWNPVEVSGSVSADGAFQLDFHFPTPAPDGYVHEWIIRGDPHCGDIVSESHDETVERHQLIADGIGDIRIERYETSGAWDQVFEIDGEEVRLAVPTIRD